jgi:disulfide bond formation protein DsbB
MLGMAHIFETFGHMAPCELCLKQRDVYWWAMGIAGAGALLGFTRLGPIATRITNILLSIVFAISVCLASYHAGVEWKWWPGPAECTGGAAGVSIADLNALLNGARGHMPACDKPAWIFLGISMAGWNAVISLGLVGFSVLATSAGRSKDAIEALPA